MIPLIGMKPEMAGRAFEDELIGLVRAALGGGLQPAQVAGSLILQGLSIQTQATVRGMIAMNATPAQESNGHAPEPPPPERNGLKAVPPA